MSSTLTTQTMVNFLAAKLPYGIATQFFQDRLNEAYRWIEQQGPYIFDLKTATITFNASTVTSSLPSDFNEGAEAALINPSTGTSQMQIPYRPVDEFEREKVFTPSPALNSIFSAWTFYGVTVPRTIEIAPAAAMPSSPITMTLIYHGIPNLVLTTGANYYTTPDEFDDLIVLRAESEVRKIYGFQFAMESRKEAEDMAAKLLDRYRSTKEALAGMVDQVRNTKEIQAKQVVG